MSLILEDKKEWTAEEMKKLVPELTGFDHGFKYSGSFNDTVLRLLLIDRETWEKTWTRIEDEFPPKRIRYNVWDGLIVIDAYFGYGPLTANPAKQHIQPELECWRNTYTDEPCKYPITHWKNIPDPPEPSRVAFPLKKP